jgi:hypothetical protein
METEATNTSHSEIFVEKSKVQSLGKARIVYEKRNSTQDLKDGLKVTASFHIAVDTAAVLKFYRDMEQQRLKEEQGRLKKETELKEQETKLALAQKELSSAIKQRDSLKTKFDAAERNYNAANQQYEEARKAIQTDASDAAISRLQTARKSKEEIEPGYNSLKGELSFAQNRVDMANIEVSRLKGISVPSGNTASQVIGQEYVNNTSVTAPVAPLIQGTIVPGNNLAEKLAWLQRSADSHNTYILEVNANENIAPTTLEYKGAINITIVIRGVGGNRTIRLKSHGNMFTVNSNVTLILDNNITLQGHSQNTSAIVNVNGGTFRMNTGSTITGNIRINNGASSYGGGVRVNKGTFEMNGGTISGNAAHYGGGVNVYGGTFTMSSGNIIGNNAYGNGGGVYVGGGTFTMRGGIISGNTATNGGGVYRGSNGNFTMAGGTITGNTAKEYGGGVYVPVGYSGAVFTKTGGTITGYNSDRSNGNMVRDESGNMLARRGHAAYADESRRKETTAGVGDKLSSSTKGSAGGWDE